MDLRAYIRKGFINRIVWKIVRREVTKWSNLKVMGGPFAGMHYTYGGFGSPVYPKLIGTYEKEVATVIEGLKDRTFDVVVNIGAGEGYYAIGMLYANICSNVVVFESYQKNRELLSLIASKNGVRQGSIEVHGHCSPRELSITLRDSQTSCILCDVEGFEAFLIDPLRVPELRCAYILVEVHDFVISGLGEELVSRMRETHTINLIPSCERSMEDAAICRSRVFDVLPALFRLLAVSEFRPPGMYWLWMTPR